MVEKNIVCVVLSLWGFSLILVFNGDRCL